MQCTSCGNQFPDNMPTCPNCGIPVNNFSGQGQSFGYQQPLTKKQFLKHANMKKCHGNLNASAIILYISSGITLLVGILSGDLFSLVDVLILVGLGLGIHLAQSRTCAIIITVYSIFNVLYYIVSTGSPNGYLIVLAAVLGTMATFSFQKSWKAYQRTGILPPA